MSEEKRRRAGLTAAELMRQLEEDPGWQADSREAELQRTEQARRNRDAATPILAELAQVGLTVGSVADLFNQDLDYRSALPVLLRWLPHAPTYDLQESIVRALAVSWFKPMAAKGLLEALSELDELAPDNLRWAFGLAIGVVVDESVLDRVAELAADSSCGSAREGLVISLKRMPDRAVPMLLELLLDEEVAHYASQSLSERRALIEPGLVEPYLAHSDARVRAEARKLLDRVDATPPS